MVFTEMVLKVLEIPVPLGVEVVQWEGLALRLDEPWPGWGVCPDSPALVKVGIELWAVWGPPDPRSLKLTEGLPCDLMPT